MNYLVLFHDCYVLWFIQEVVYAHDLAAIAVWALALFGMPTHRRPAAAVTWLFVVLGGVLIAVYGAWQEAPRLAGFLTAALAYLFLRWALWRLPPPSAGETKVRFPWLRLRVAWTRRWLEDYFRADPRGTYWLDLARAVRGLPLPRTADERRAAVAAASHLPPWRQTVWRLIFRLVEARIQLYVWLPAWWHRPLVPPGRLDLDEPHPRAVLEAEQQAAWRNMLEHWTGHTFEDYLSRDTVARRETLRFGARWGQKYVLHLEALSEYLTFRTPWQPNETGLVQVAWKVYQTWRQRRQYDVLWFPETRLSTVPAPALDEPETEAAADEDRPAAENGGAAVATATANGSPPIAAAGGFGLPESPETSTAGPAAGATPGLLVTDESAAQTEAPAKAAVPASEAATGLRLTDESAAQTEVPAEAAVPAPEATTATTADDAAAGPAIPAPAPRAAADSDEEFFEAVETASARLDEPGAASPAVDQGPLLSPQEQARLADLQLASQLLEAFLAFERTGDFARDAERLERLLDQPKRLTAAVMLLMLYCLRRDYSGRRADRQKVDLVLRLTDRLQQFQREDRHRESRQVFRAMQLDWLLERGAYAQLLERLSGQDSLTPYEMKLLADAEALLAQQLTGHDELRDMLRYEAIGHYFQAGFRPMWTLPYASLILRGIDHHEDLLRLWREYPVAITDSQSRSIG